ncbi:hypothetical protein AB990_11240 [Alkalihalobacillus pseudalcaliphilus]|nr:hypothetical protein AB990_11240 [Alkalihalobacillus pseudalcaliphilus]
MVDVRRYGQSDEQALQQLLKENKADSSYMALIQSEKYTAAFGAYVEKRLVGIIIGWENAFHPSSTYVKFLIDSQYRQLDVAPFLFNELVEHVKRGFIQISVWESEKEVIHTLQMNQFNEIRRTYMPTLELNNIELKVQFSDSVGRITTLGEMVSTPQLMKQLVRLVQQNYEETHRANPVAHMSVEQWEKLVMAEDIISEASFVYVDEKNEIIAYSFLHAGEDEMTNEFGWCGVKDLNQIDILPYLATEQMIWSREQGKTYITGEFDSTSPYARALYQDLPFQKSPAWLTFQKQKKD